MFPSVSQFWDIWDLTGTVPPTDGWCISPGPGLKIIPPHRSQCCLGKYLHSLTPHCSNITPQLFLWRKYVCWNPTSEAHNLTAFYGENPLGGGFNSLTINIKLDWGVNRENKLEKCLSITTGSQHRTGVMQRQGAMSD